MENTRPKLSDPEELALIRSIYFDDNKPTNSNLDPQEALERQEARSRNNKPNSQ